MICIHHVTQNKSHGVSLVHHAPPSIFSRAMMHLWIQKQQRLFHVSGLLRPPIFHCYLTGKTDPRKPRDKDWGGTPSKVKTHAQKWQWDPKTNHRKKEARIIKRWPGQDGVWKLQKHKQEAGADKKSGRRTVIAMDGTITGKMGTTTTQLLGRWKKELNNNEKQAGIPRESHKWL